MESIQREYSISKVFACLFLLQTFSSILLVEAQNWQKALDSPYAAELKSCKGNWGQISQQGDATKVSDCFLKLIASVRPQMARPEGLPAIKLQSFEPFVIPGTVSIGATGGPLSGELTGMNIKGITKGLTPEHMKMSFDPKTGTTTLVVKLPKDSVTLTTDYRITLDIASVFRQNGGSSAGSSGRILQGSLVAEAETVEATLSANLQKAENGDFRVTSAKATFDALNLKMTFKSSNPQDPLGGMLNLIMSSEDSAQRVLSEIKPAINKQLARALGTLLHGGLKNLEKI